MRKSTKLIAGLGVVAGLGVALAPLATFAAVTTPTRTDHLTVTLSEVCTVNSAELESTTVDLHNYFTASPTAGNEATFTFVDGSDTDAFDPAGAATEQKLTIRCNSATGYKVLANAVNPTGQESSNTGVTIPAGTAIDGNTSYWAADITTSGNLTETNSGYFAINTANFIVASNTGGSATSGDSFEMGYKVGASTALKAGTYEGSVAYTVVKGAN